MMPNSSHWKVAFFTCLVIIMLGQKSLAQSTDVDYLENIAALNRQDSNQVRALRILGEYYMRRDFEKSRKFLEQGEGLAIKINHQDELYKIITYQGAVQLRLNQLDSAEMLFHKALDIATAIEPLPVGISGTYSGLGLLAEERGQLDQAYEYYIKGVKICESSDQEPALNLLANMYSRLSSLYQFQKEYDKAMEYAEKAFYLALEEDNTTHQGYGLGQIAGIQVIQEEYEKAIHTYKDALSLQEGIMDSLGIFVTLTNMAKCHTKLNNYELANAFFEEAISLGRRMNFETGLPTALLPYAKLKQIQNQHRQAIQYGRQILAMSPNDNEEKAETYQLLSDSYAALKNYKQAYELNKLYSAFQDTLTEQKQREHVRELETKYRVENKERENEYLKSQGLRNQTILTQRNYLIVGAMIVILLLAVLASVLYRAYHLKQSYNQQLESTVAERTTELETSNQQLEQANYELRAFNYIASHDIKEPIRNIGNYAGLVFRKLPPDLQEAFEEHFSTIKGNTVQLYTLIEDFARYTTFSRNNKEDKQAVDLNLLVDGIQQNLHSTIQQTNGHIHFTDLPTIVSSYALLYIALKNVIQNGLKFNDSPVPTVTVSYRSTDNHHEIVIADNGIGIKEEYFDSIFDLFKRLHNREVYQGSGIGLAIVKLAMDKLEGEVRIESEKGKGSQFILSLGRGENLQNEK